MGDAVFPINFYKFSQDGLDGVPTNNLNGGVHTNGNGNEINAVPAGSENDQQNRKVKPQISMVDLDQIVANSLKDIEVYEDDGDDDDPDLLKELSEIIEPKEPQQSDAPNQTSSDVILPTTNLVPELLKARIEMYKIAEANAKTANENSRARRFSRGITTLETMLKQVLSGEAVNMEDIPPEVITKVTDNSKLLASVSTEKDEDDA